VSDAGNLSFIRHTHFNTNRTNLIHYCVSFAVGKTALNHLFFT